MEARTSTQLETAILGAITIDNEIIDKALQAGLTPEHFADGHYREQWRLAVALRTEGADVSDSTLYAKAHALGILDKLGGHAKLLRPIESYSALGYNEVLASLLDVYAKREAYKLLKRAVDGLAKQSLELGELRELADGVTTLCAGKQSLQRSLADITAEAIREAEDQIAGKVPTRTLITTGLPTFDRYAMPIESHEYVVVGARTSHGKSSFLLQIAGHNLSQKKRVAIFTLETSDKSVIKQIAGQRAGVNLRKLDMEPMEKQKEYLAKLRYAQTSDRLLVFDRDLTLEQIEARCRLLKASFCPDLVIIDYLGIIGVGGNDAMERMTRISSAMIPLTKYLGCAVIVGCQLNRSSEREERPPTRTDFRDSGSIEQDGHRLICIWRKPGQFLDAVSFDCQLMQLKLRDGPTASVDLKFHSPSTRFFEEAK